MNYPGATPETMANNVATPLERQFMQIPGLELVTSNSAQGHTSFTLQFELSKSLDAAATDVQSAITQATGKLPVDLPCPPTFTKTNPNDQPIMYVGLTSDTVTEGQLYDYANTQVGERISILPGVSQVAVFGTQSAVRIKADPSADGRRNITHRRSDRRPSKTAPATPARANLTASTAHSCCSRKASSTRREDYDNLIVSQTNGAPIYLKDVAERQDSVQDERINMRFWVRGYPEPSATVVVAVFRAAGSNAVQVAKRCAMLLAQHSRELPGSVLHRADLRSLADHRE